MTDGDMESPDIDFEEVPTNEIAINGDGWYDLVSAAVDFILAGKLKIRHKKVDGLGGTIKDFIPNDEQRAILHHVLECAKNEVPVRVIILKARQIGMSTVIAALFYTMTSIVKGVHAIIAGSDEQNRNAIWRIYQKFKETDERQLKTRYDSRREILFKDTGSGLFVSIASEDLGKGDMITFFHGSEYAFWDDPEDTLDSILACVSDHYTSMVFLESTGKEGTDFELNFRKHYEQMQDFLAGETDKQGRKVKKPSWYPIFFPWPMHKAYSKVIDTDDAFEIIQTKDADEIELMEQGATVSQIAWRRETIAEKYRGDKRRFGVMFPATVDEAFSAGSHSFFNRDSIDRLKQEVREPDSTYEIILSEDKKSEVLSETPEGRLRVYRPPIFGRKYVIGGDAAGESKDAVDPRHKSQSALVVVDEFDGEIVACWTGHMGGHEFGDLLAAVGYWYNTAHLVPEKKEHGYMAITRLAHQLNYPNIYIEEEHDKLDIKESDRIGWRQSAPKRLMILDTFQRLVYEDCVMICDRELVSQMSTFVEKPSGKIKAKLNTKDDLVISAAMALFVASRGKSWGVRDRSAIMREQRQKQKLKLMDRSSEELTQPSDFGFLYESPVVR